MRESRCPVASGLQVSGAAGPTPTASGSARIRCRPVGSYQRFANRTAVALLLRGGDATLSFGMNRESARTMRARWAVVAACASSLILVVGNQPAARRVPASSRKTGVLVGHAFGWDGRPVADTRLCLRLFRLYHASELGFRSDGGMGRESYRAGSLTVDSLWTQSDSNGRFQLELPVMPSDSAVREHGLPSLLLNASIWVPESGASYPCPIVIEPEKRCEVVFRLRRTGDLECRVVDPLGSPVEGISVTLSQDVPHWTLFQYPTMGEPWSFAATSGPDGRNAPLAVAAAGGASACGQEGTGRDTSGL